jgi:TonB dependent receptor-like, beta-barrel/Carboxypeptidase regulatory-like domain/TonB-dependent Receptor Plug Domain
MTTHGRCFALGSLAALALTAPVAAQTSSGRIVGRVLDAETGEALAGAQIVVAGTQVGALSGVDGRYLMVSVPAGTHSLQVTYIGHGSKTVEGVLVPAGETVVQDISLASSAIEVAGITVSAARERGTVTAALDEQRTAVGVMSSTTADQIAKSPDSDAAQAVKRVSGVTVQDGKYVFVRGLGERYTTTSLNGARVPSPEPEKKVVPLDLFPSSLLESITTAKTFTPDQPGDFSGAEVNLRTRSFPAQRMAQLSVTGGFNSLATGKSILVPPTTGGEWLAMAAHDRALPTRLTNVTDFTTLSQADINGLIRALPQDWIYQNGNGAPNVSGGLSFGGDDPVLGRRVGYIGSLTYSRSQEVHAGETRARAVPGDSLGTPVPYNTFIGSTGQSSVLWGGLLNLTTYLGINHKIHLNNTYDRSADNSAHVDWGTLEEFQQVDSVRRTQLSYVERTVRSNQIGGEHQLGEANKVSWSVTSSAVTRKQPDRSDLAYGYEFAPTGERLPLAWLGFIPEAAKRTSADLTENALDGRLDYALSLGGAAFKVGGAFRHTKRVSTTASYNLRALGLSAAARAATPEELFDGQYTEGNQAHITLEPNTAGGSYDARDDVSAGYAMAEIPLGSRIRVIGGARVERWKLDMNAEPLGRDVINITRSDDDVLPSLAVNAKITDGQTLRLSATQTLSRPEYREMAPISYRDMVGEREVFGDSSLVRTKVQNYDARWEWYPSLDELVSVAFFAKHFDNPIEQIDVATSGVSQLSFINAESAFNYGVEVELRKGLGFLAGGLQPLGVFSNVTLMKSRINTSNSTLSALTNDERPMVGQAPYVVNAGLTYASASGTTSATLLYNVVGHRISTAAVQPITVDTYEQAREQLDLSLRFGIRAGMTGKLDATNLLDSPYEELQGDVVRYRYTLGRSVGFGVSWNMR